jgi:hypothetical protein
MLADMDEEMEEMLGNDDEIVMELLAKAEPPGLQRRVTSVMVLKDLASKVIAKIENKEAFEEAKLCRICYYNEITPTPLPIPDGDKGTFEFECKHRFCSECVAMQFEQAVSSNSLDKVSCLEHGCAHQVTEDELTKALSGATNQEIIEKYHRFKRQNEIDKDPLTMWCFKPGCEGYMTAASVDTELVSCATCGTEACFKCREAIHEGRTCDEAMDAQVGGWADEKGVLAVKQCPVCKARIEKNEGCNHMTCIICRYEFCWNCLAYAGYEVDHFNRFNPDNCGITQM